VYDDPDDDCDDDAMLSVSDSLFRDNYARAGGALVCYRFTECSIAGTTFENNQADSSIGVGGAIYVQGWVGDDLQQGQLAITGSTFRDNQANNGGAILIECSDASTALISDCTFDNNIAGYSGGGLDIYIAGELRIEDCEFLGQQVGFAGGAMDISGQGPTVEIGNCLFESNESVYNGVLSLSPDDSVITISESEFLSNPDRAIALSGDGNTLDLVETVFEDNYQALDVDAGMGNAPPSTVTMRGCTIFRSTSYGAALGSWGALVTLESLDSDWGDGADPPHRRAAATRRCRR
jgi:hypothetical protein